MYKKNCGSKGAKGEGNIRKKTQVKNGKTYTYWEGCLTTGRDPGTGKQKRRYFTGPTQQAVRKKMAATAVEIDNGTYTEPTKLTVGKWLDIWANDYLGEVKPFTEVAYKGYIKNHIKPALGAIRLDSLKPHAVQAFYKSLERDKGLSPKTIKNIHGVLHEALDQAVQNQYIRNNPSASCKLLRVQKKEIHPLLDDEVNSFLTAIEGHEFEDLYKVTLFTGMRKCEATGLSWKDINFDEGTILIHQQLHKEKKKGGKYKLVPTKNDKPRKITPAPAVMKILKHHRAVQAEQRLKAGTAWKNWEKADLVFTNEFGRYLADSTVYNKFKRIAESIGRPDARVHDLRHTFAVMALRSGMNIKAVSSMLGHSSVSFTLDTYAEFTSDMQKESAEKMQAFITEVINL